MNKITFASAAGFIATGFAAIVLGLAAPASADIGHHQWIHDMQQQGTFSASQVTVGNGR